MRWKDGEMAIDDNDGKARQYRDEDEGRRKEKEKIVFQLWTERGEDRLWRGMG